MKSHLMILALMITHLHASSPAFPDRPWKAGTPGLNLLQGTRYDDATDTFEVKASSPAVIPLMIDTQPNVGTHSYALRGEVRYENVGGTGFLETWTTIGGNKAFSRSLGEDGPMAKLAGSSAWREFMLPMNMMGSSIPVKQIEMNVVLPDGGRVWLRHLRLESFDFGAPVFSPMLVMVSLALIGALVALLIWRSRHRRSREAEIKRMMAADA